MFQSLPANRYVENLYLSQNKSERITGFCVKFWNGKFKMCKQNLNGNHYQYSALQYQN